MMRFCGILFVLLLGLVICPATADAQLVLTKDKNIPTVYPFEEKTTVCLASYPDSRAPDPTIKAAWESKYAAKIGVSIDQWREKYTARMVYCIREMMEESTKVFLAKLVNDYAMRAISVVVLFAVAIFGIKVLGGMLQNPKAEAFSLLMKIGIILLIVTACKDATNSVIVKFWFDTTNLMVELVSGAGVGAFGSTSFCPTAPNAVGQWFGVWDRFDCLISRFVGYGSAVAAGTGFMAMIGAVLFSGGTWLAFMAFAAIIAIAMFLFRSVMMVVMSYGALGLMLLMLPIFLPLILFKATEKYLWDCWFRYAVGYAFQPALTIGFLLFAVTVLDDLMINGSPNVYTIYNPATNETRVEVIKPGMPIPPGAKKAVVPPSEILGFKYTDSADKQREDVSGLYRRDKRMDMPKVSGDSSSYSQMDEGCGETSGNKILDAADKLCTNASLCAKARAAVALAKYTAFPSENSWEAFKKAACELARSKGEKTSLDREGADIGNNTFDGSFVTSLQLELNRPDTADGFIPAGQVPSRENKHNSKVMQLLGYVGSVLIVCGTFFTFMGTVPAMVQGLCGVPGQKISPASPAMGGKTLMQRIEGAMLTADDAWKKSLGDKKAGVEKGTFAERGLLAPAKGFVQGFIAGEQVEDSFQTTKKEKKFDKSKKETGKESTKENSKEGGDEGGDEVAETETTAPRQEPTPGDAEKKAPKPKAKEESGDAKSDSEEEDQPGSAKSKEAEAGPPEEEEEGELVEEAEYADNERGRDR